MQISGATSRKKIQTMRWQGLALAYLFSTFLGAQQQINGPLVLFIGAPGSGKSTQGVLAAKKLGVPVVSVEELISNNQAAFKKIRRTGLSGMEPETDPVLNRLFAERLKKGDLANGAVLDGYPSTKDHADFLSKMVSEGKLPNPVVIQLDIPDHVVRKRMANQPGSTPASVEQRLKDYHREMGTVRLYFPNADITTIDGSKKIKVVTETINALLESRFKK